MVMRRIYVDSTRAVYVGPGFVLPPHSNDTTVVAVGLHTDVSWRIRDAEGQWTDWHREPGALIPARTMHHLCTDGDVALLYLDPLADCVDELTGERVEEAAQRLRDLPVGDVTLTRAFGVMSIPQRVPHDEDVVRVIRMLDRHPDRFRTLDDAADLAALSPSWFRVKFAREVGLPFRRYRLWRRMAVVMRALADGMTLTDAAHQAGFASSAHLSTSFKTMFGMSPMDLLGSGVAIDTTGLDTRAPA